MTAPEGSTATTKIAAPSVRPVKPPQPAPPISASSLARAAEEGVGDQAAAAGAETVSGAAATVGETAEVPPAPELDTPDDDLFTSPEAEEPTVATVEASAEEPTPPIADGGGQPFPDAEFTPIGRAKVRKTASLRIRRSSKSSLTPRRVPNRPSRQRSSESRSRTRWTSSPSLTASENKRRWASVVGSPRPLRPTSISIR